MNMKQLINMLTEIYPADMVEDHQKFEDDETRQYNIPQSPHPTVFDMFDLEFGRMDDPQPLLATVNSYWGKSEASKKFAKTLPHPDDIFIIAPHPLGNGADRGLLTKDIVRLTAGVAVYKHKIWEQNPKKLGPEPLSEYADRQSWKHFKPLAMKVYQNSTILP